MAKDIEALAGVDLTDFTAVLKAALGIKGRTRLERAATQTIGTAAWTDVQWDTEIEDDAAAFAPGTSTINIVVPSGMTQAKVSVWANWATSGTGQRYMALLKNGTATRAQTRQPVSESPDSLFQWLYGLSAGDILKVQVQQTTGGNLALQGSAFGGPSSIEIEWLA